MSATTTSNFYDIHIFKFSTACHDSRSMRISVNIFHPLACNFCRHTLIVSHTYKFIVFVVFRSVVFRYINTGKICQTQKLFFLSCISINGIKNLLDSFFTFANNESICHRSQRFRIKSSTRTSNDNKRFFFITHFSTQLDVAKFKYGQQIVVVHFKGQHYENNTKVRKLTLCFHAQKSSLSFLVLFD